jgi:leucyl aminopeptidase
LSSRLPEDTPPRISRRAAHAGEADLARLDALLVAVPADATPGTWKTLPNGAWLQAEMTRRRCRPGSVLTTRAGNDPGTLIVAGLRPAGATAFQALALAGRMFKEIAGAQPRRVGLDAVAMKHVDQALALEALAAATLAGAFELPSFKSEAQPGSVARSITVFGDPPGLDLQRTLATAAGNNLARWLTALPGNRLTPGSYRERIERLARREGWRARFLDTEALRRKGAGAFLAVAQGNGVDDAGIMHLQYKPKGTRKRAAAAVALVGKGICFDTGGTNLKAHKSMLDMHTDMEGSAVALGTLLALTRLKANFPVSCWLAITENRIGPKAYKPQDVVTAANGTTIHVIHTDAEGRMVLADALALAAADEPAMIVDFATLTGACVNALTERYSGVFTNRPQWRSALERAGAQSGERVWCFPTDDDFDSDLESSVADVMQCSTDNKGDHILAARFLNRFVPSSIPWAHVDLAAGQRNGGLGHINSDITGFGVRFAVNLLLDQGRAVAPARLTAAES